MAIDGLGYVACDGQALIGVAQSFIIPVDLPPRRPAPREYFLLEPTVDVQIWKYSQGMEVRGFWSSVKTFPGNKEVATSTELPQVS